MPNTLPMSVLLTVVLGIAAAPVCAQQAGGGAAGRAARVRPGLADTKSSDGDPPRPMSRGFEAILWWRSGQKPDPAFFAAVRAAGFAGVSVGKGQNAGAVRQAGLGFYSDQVCGKGVLELRPAQIQPLTVQYTKERDDSLLLRPAVLSKTETLVRLARTVDERIQAELRHGPVAVSLGDEVSVTRHANPLDVCFDETTLRNFRAFLKARYGRVHRLNMAWSTAFASFDAVRPLTADAIRARELGSGVYPANLAPWAAHREFMDIEFARLIRRARGQSATVWADRDAAGIGLRRA